ncbi:MAG TPA: hypothetical protein VGL58_08475 [Caulobacteraceae bacterium]|jgi:hypothetical protein
MKHPPSTESERATIDRITVELAKETGSTDQLYLLTRAIRAGIASSGDHLLTPASRRCR